MSRIGKQPIEIPKGTDVQISGNSIAIKGPKGELVRAINDNVAVKHENSQIVVSPARQTLLALALWGTYASLIRSMVSGVNEPFVKKLEVEGIGYRVELAGKVLKLSVGYSHPVELDVPDGIAVSVEKNVITVEGINKEAVGQFAANVRAVKKPEPYKGKGIRYQGEIIRRKQGKKAAA